MSEELGGVVAKMKVNTIECYEGGGKKVKLGAVYGKEGENKDFASATPSGECWMMISSPAQRASDFFEPGESYYVTFTKAPK